MAKCRWSVALALLLLFPHASWAGVNIAASCRVKNRPPGRCGWCALETLARYHHLKALYGLARKHPSRCCPERSSRWPGDPSSGGFAGSW